PAGRELPTGANHRRTATGHTLAGGPRRPKCRLVTARPRPRTAETPFGNGGMAVRGPPETWVPYGEKARHCRPVPSGYLRCQAMPGGEPRVGRPAVADPLLA